MARQSKGLNFRTAGIVLAGGASKRMGTDKADLEVGGVSLLQQAKTLLTDSGLSYVFACGRRDDCNIRQEVADKGPLAGIMASMQFCQPLGIDRLVFVPVDMPMLQPGDIYLLVEQSMSTGTPVCFDTGPLPLITPLTDEILSVTRGQCKGDNRSLGSWLQTLGAQVMHSANPPHFLNINHPAQWQTFKARYASN